MTDHRHFRDEPVDHPATWFMPGRHAGPSEVYERKGYVLRVSGDTAALRERLGVEPRRIPREFVCPVHGRFTVEEDEQTDEVACPLTSWTPAGTDLEYATKEECQRVIFEACGRSYDKQDLESQTCAATSPWSPSVVGQGKSAGEMDG